MTLRDLRRHIGQLVIAGFAGESLAADVKSLAREFDLAGVILFARNVVSPGQVRELAGECSAMASDWPLWISVDQEGGRVARLRSPFTEWPPAQTLGRCGDIGLAARFASALAAELAAVGINLDYAPVLDVLTNPSNQVIGDRALAGRAEDVARLGTAIIEALQGAGVAACGKHFPGHGDTAADSHLDLPVLEHPPDRLEAVELVPFRAAVAAGVASIMTAHVLLPALDAEWPATLSPAILDRLRSGMGFQGLVISDDLSMRAISAQYDATDAAVAAVSAGCDTLLLCQPDPDEQGRVLEALVHAVESGTLARTRVEDALTRQRRTKERFLARAGSTRPARRAWQDVVGCDAHLAVATEMSRFL